MDSTLWNSLPWQYIPSWFKPMLDSIGAETTSKAECLMWRFAKHAHLQIDVDKLLFYANGNPLQYRTYFDESWVD